MALSQHSKNLAKQALNKDNFTNEHLIEAYGVNQDQLLQLVEQKSPQELYDATYSMYLNAYGDEATAENYVRIYKEQNGIPIPRVIRPASPSEMQTVSSKSSFLNHISISLYQEGDMIPWKN